MRTALLISLLLPLGALAQRADTVVVRTANSAKAGPYVFSQQELQQMVDIAGTAQPYSGNVRTFDRRYEGLRGTPYYLPYWAKGRVGLANGQRNDNVLVKYDAYRQELVLSHPPARSDSVIIDRGRVNWFVLQPADSGAAVLFRRYPTLRSNDATLRDSYFRVLYAGRHSLLQRVGKTFHPANYKDPYSPDIRYDSYTDNSAYYVLKPDGRAIKVKLTTKNLLDALAADEPANVPKDAADRRKLTIRTEWDAVRFVEGYDKL